MPWFGLRKTISRKTLDRALQRAQDQALKPDPEPLLRSGLQALQALEDAPTLGQTIRENKAHLRALDRILGHLSRRALPWHPSADVDPTENRAHPDVDALARSIWLACGIVDYESFEGAHRQLDVQADYELAAPARGVLIPISVESFVLQLEIEADLARSTRGGALSNIDWAPMASTTAFLNRYELSLKQLSAHAAGRASERFATPNMETIAELRDALALARHALTAELRAAA